MKDKKKGKWRTIVSYCPAACLQFHVPLDICPCSHNNTAAADHLQFGNGGWKLITLMKDKQSGIICFWLGPSIAVSYLVCPGGQAGDSNLKLITFHRITKNLINF